MSNPPVAKSVVIPPPVMGWNAKDPISETEQLYAVEAINHFSDGSTVDIRKGNSLFATNTFTTTSIGELITQAGVRTLITLGITGTTGRYKFYNTSGASVFDASDVAVNSAPTFLSTMVNFRNNIFFTTAWNFGAVQYVYRYDGSTTTLVGANLFNPTIYKNRIYFIKSGAAGTGTATILYLGVDAISGGGTDFDVQSLLNLGGKVIFIGQTSRTGDINQNFFVIISDQGEVLVYQGDYPGSTTWAIVGHYYMPPAVGERSFVYWGNDIAVITYQGIILLSEVMKGNSDFTFLSDKINPEFSKILSVTSSTKGYACGIHYPRGNMLVFNIPKSGGVEQFVYNTTTSSWWRWQGLTAVHWTIFNDNLVFTDGTTVYNAWDGYAHAYETTMTTKLRCAFNYLGDREHVKTFTAARPTLYESENLSLTLGNDVDFTDTTATSVETTTGDTSYKLYQPMMGLNGIGKAVSIRIDGTVTTKRRSIQAIEVFYNEGGLV